MNNFIEEFNKFFDGSAHIEIDGQGRLDITIGTQTMLVSLNIEKALLDSAEVLGVQSKEPPLTIDDKVRNHCRDLLRTCSTNWRKIGKTEIRVWCHPRYVGHKGDPYYAVFDSFADARRFIERSPEAEPFPEVVSKGKESDLLSAVGESDKE